MSHFRSDPELAKAYDARCERDVSSAVMLVLATEHSIAVGDVPTPCLTTLASLPTQSDRNAYGLERAPEIARERRAIGLVRNADGVRARQADHITSTAVAARQAFVTSRVADLEREHFAQLRAGWLATAETEAAARFDSPAPPIETQPELPRARRRVA